jgi:hypothetical protein
MYKIVILIVFITITIISGTHLFEKRSYGIDHLPSIDDQNKVSIELSVQFMWRFNTNSKLCDVYLLVCDAMGLDGFIKLISNQILFPLGIVK